jgi:para-nitrobenzyl esterase
MTELNNGKGLVLIVRRWLFGVLVFTLALKAQQQVRVKTNSGEVVGKQTAALRTFFGIPYASPPIGDLRWKAPRPPVAWNSPLQAASLGSECMHVPVGLFDVSGEVKGQIKGSENCLFLNIYAPANSAGGRLPVMVWIHGGGFTSGAGSLYDASVLAEKHGVVVVTFNYRLGALGFLALPTLSAEASDGSSGNYGLLDQQAALRWVRDNIAQFGGDPGNVTIFGESAGGMSVCAQLASPTAAGLFQKAIIQSGLCGSPNNNVTLADASRRNLAYAAKLGCRNGDLPCLRKVDAKLVTNTPVPGRQPLGNLVWSPVYGAGILPRTLPTAFESGAFQRVPVMNGTNHDEGRLFISLASPNGKPLQLYQYWGGTGLLVGAAKSRRVLTQYPYRRYGTPAMAFATVFTDAMFSCPAWRIDEALSRHVPVYAFEFNDPNAVTDLKPLPGLPSLGAFHSSSLVYVFQTPLVGLANPARFSPEQRTLSDWFSSAWAAFAKTGNPAISGLPRWQPFQAARPDIQAFTPTRIGNDAHFFDEHKCALWSDLNLR